MPSRPLYATRNKPAVARIPSARSLVIGQAFLWLEKDNLVIYAVSDLPNLPDNSEPSTPPSDAPSPSETMDWSELVAAVQRGENEGMERLYAVFARGVRFLLKDEFPPETIVRGRDERLGQVFRNLIDNAIRYTPSGGKITVRAGYGKGEHSSSWLEVSPAARRWPSVAPGITATPCR